MTTSRYYIARFAQAFGYFRKNQRMADAAGEMHLLREAEAYLGAAIWENVENIAELSVEYWNLRKFIKEREIVREKLDACQAKLDQAHEEREVVLSKNPEIQQDLIDERIALLVELEHLAAQRDEVITNAREVRRAYDGLKMKFQVLTKEASDSPSQQEEIEKVKAELIRLKAKFSALKNERIRIGQKIEADDAKVDQVEELLNEKKKNRRIYASEAFQVIGDSNKEMSVLRAEWGVLETQMRQLYAEVGRYVSRNAFHNAPCAEAAASQKGLVVVMRAIRRSIALNHRLAGTA